MIYYDSTNKTGIVDLFYDLTSTNTTSYPLAKVTRDVNNAFADFMARAIVSSGKWQIDDTNHTDYPILKINITSGQQDYPFTIDGTSAQQMDGSTAGSQILDIQRVELADSSGNFSVLKAFDQTEYEDSLQNLSGTSGVPTMYDKLANGVFLFPKPNYTRSNALYIYYSRTPTYFLSTDTTRKAGIPEVFHPYLAYKPAYLYAVVYLPNLAAGYLNIVRDYERRISEWYAFRDRDEKKRLVLSNESNK